jgi:hypothetical protein
LGKLIARTLFTVILTSCCSLHAQQPHASSSQIKISNFPDWNPKWQAGAFAAGGYWPFNRITGRGVVTHAELHFYNAGLFAGRFITRPHGKGIFRRRVEALIEFMPFWLARYPSQELSVMYPGEPNPVKLRYGPYSVYGLTVTPLLFRWNYFHGINPRYVPWFQIGGGLLWTNSQFPYLAYSGKTSKINFTPQAGIGENFLLDNHHSIDVAFKAIHISNAYLGPTDPGLDITYQWSIGFSFWQ